MSWRIIYTAQAQKDAKKITAAGLKDSATNLIDLLKKDPFSFPPPFEKLQGDLSGAYSRRINIQHRIVYQVFPDEQVVKIIRMYTHYK